MNGTRVKLSDVVAINPLTRPEEGASGDVAFVAMAQVSESGRIATVELRPLSEVRKGYTAFAVGDVLLAKITPCFENGKAALVESLPTSIAFGSTEFHVLRPTGLIDGRFLFHLVWNPVFRRLGASRMTGSAGQKRVPAAFVANYEFELPSLPEQKRISNILDHVERLRCLRQDTIRLTSDFLRATFAMMFGDPHTNARELPVAALGEVAKLKSGDFLPSHEMAGSGDVFVYGGNGINGKHDRAMFGETKLVIGRVGAYCGAVHLTKSPSWITDNALYVSELNAQMRLEYLAFALNQANLNQYSSQSGQPLVSASRLYPVKIVLPPLDLQDGFLAVLNRSRVVQSAQEGSLHAIEDLSQSLSSELLA